MRGTGTVSTWAEDEGWGVIDSSDTPGGCWFHVASLWHLELPAMHGGDAIEGTGGYRDTHVGEKVRFDYEHAKQDGYEFRAHSVWPLDRWSPPMRFRLST